MAGKMGKFVIIFFVAAICLTSMVSAVDAEINPTIQVGLFYGQNALPGANLENYTGSGYRLGYFDEDLHFVTLGHTPETQISMVKTQNVSLSNGNYVDGTGSVTGGPPRRFSGLDRGRLFRACRRIRHKGSRDGRPEHPWAV